LRNPAHSAMPKEGTDMEYTYDFTGRKTGQPFEKSTPLDLDRHCPKRTGKFTTYEILYGADRWSHPKTLPEAIAVASKATREGKHPDPIEIWELPKDGHLPRIYSVKGELVARAVSATPYEAMVMTPLGFPIERTRYKLKWEFPSAV